MRELHAEHETHGPDYSIHETGSSQQALAVLLMQWKQQAGPERIIDCRT